MRAFRAIFLKELRGLVLSPTFFIVCFLCAAIFSWVFPITLRMFSQSLQTFMFQPGGDTQQMNIHYGVFLRHLSHLNLILIFISPALTMRLFAEERKLRSFVLLLTAPISSAQIVAGKYLAAVVAVGVVALVALLYPISTVLFTKISWMPLLIAFKGICLVGAVYVAMDLFASSLTESAIVAYVMAVIFNIGIWFVGIGVDMVDSSFARATFEHISLNQHLMGMVEGTVRTSSIVFFSSLIFLFCFLSERVVESIRWR
jgi:ABC-2 type transport system permease protein